jgi:hypothetical protein
MINDKVIVDMVLTSIVNNKSILKSIVSDISDRFSTNLEEDKLENFLSAVSLTKEKNELILV